MSRKTRQQPRARAAVVPLRVRRVRLPLPSMHSLATGVAVAALAVVAYGAARETSVFAIRTVTVSGAPAPLAAKVRRALEPLEGESLVALRADDVERLATALPEIESVAYDRAFPHTLAVVVNRERPLAVARRGAQSWLVARSGRVVRKLSRGALPSLPRIWLERTTSIRVGRPLGARGGGEQVAALAPVKAVGLQGRIASVRIDRHQLVYVLRGGLELRVGTREALRLKLTIARRILAQTTLRGYLDVSVPERPVAGGGTKPQPEL